MEEIWKTIDINPNYEVSSLGNVRSVTRQFECADGRTRTYQGKMLHPHFDLHGYKRVALGREQDNIAVHRLVAFAFIPNPNNYGCVNHKDGNKANNTVENLEWCDYSMNLVHAYATGLNQRPKKVKQMTLDGELIKVWDNANQCEQETGIDHRCISRCCTGKRKKHKGYTWAFL